MCVSNMEKEYLEYLKNELLEMALTNEDDKARKRLIEKEIPRNYVKLLAIADTHLGCYQDRRDILDYLANKVIQNDVDYVIHCGDVVDGVSSFQDQLDNLRYYSFEMQSQYFIENYPEFGVPTIMVSGNHDGWWKNYVDKDIIKYISKNRDDIEYLGGSDGIFRVNDYTMLMMHGHKSNQKIFERYQDYDIDLAFRGHSHTHVVKYPDNIVHIPCLVNKRLHRGMENSFQELGVWWITIDLRDKLVYKRLELFSERTMKKSLIKESRKY